MLGVRVPTMANCKTVRAELDQKLYQIYEMTRIRYDMNKQPFLLRVVREWLAANGIDLSSVDAPVVKRERKAKRGRKAMAPNPILIGTEINLDRIHINVRQLARLNKLEVEGCYTDVDDSIKKRDLLYPPDKEAEVRAWMASCPTGGKKKSEGKSESKRGPYNTLSRRMFSVIMDTLSNQTLPMSIKDLHEVLTEKGCAPNGHSQKSDLRIFIKEECSSIVFDKDNDICYLANVETPIDSGPTLEETVSMQETIQEKAPVEDETKAASPKVPSYFPKNWKPVG